MHRALIAHGLSAESFTLLSEGVLVDSEASKAFLKLSKRAAKAGFDMRIASAFRSYDRQTRIINEKWLGQRVVLNDQGDRLDRSVLTDAQWLEAILTKPMPRAEETGQVKHHILLPDGYWDMDKAEGGIGCVLATPNTTLSPDTTALLATMKDLTATTARGHGDQS